MYNYLKKTISLEYTKNKLKDEKLNIWDIPYRFLDNYRNFNRMAELEQNDFELVEKEEETKEETKEEEKEEDQD